MGILEIFLVLLVALIVIPPDDLPQVMQAVGKVLRELRLASNTVMRELGGALEEPPSYLTEQRTPPPKPPAEPPTDSSPQP